MEIDKLTRWSYQRQFLGKQGTNALKVLKDIGGVYSWHPSASISLWNRLPGFDKNEFNELDEKRLAIRIPAMRLSNYMLDRENAPMVFAATVPGPSDLIGKNAIRKKAGMSTRSCIHHGKNRLLDECRRTKILIRNKRCLQKRSLVNC